MLPSAPQIRATRKVEILGVTVDDVGVVVEVAEEDAQAVEGLEEAVGGVVGEAVAVVVSLMLSETTRGWRVIGEVGAKGKVRVIGNRG